MFVWSAVHRAQPSESGDALSGTNHLVRVQRLRPGLALQCSVTFRVLLQSGTIFYLLHRMSPTKVALTLILN